MDSDIRWLRGSLELGLNELAALLGATRLQMFNGQNGEPTPCDERARALRALIESELDAELHPWLRMFWDFDPRGGPPLWHLLRTVESGSLAEVAGPALRALVAPMRDHIQSAREQERQAHPGGGHFWREHPS